MVRTVHELIHELERFQPEEENWLPLDDLIQEIILTQAPHEAIDAMLGLFERYPDEDGYGIFWTMLREIEHFLGYEGHVFDSLRRQPSMFAVLMVGRMLKSDRYELEANFLVKLLHEVAAHPGTPPGVIEAAQALVEHRARR